jgi:anti-sigma factor RsiW
MHNEPAIQRLAGQAATGLHRDRRSARGLRVARLVMVLVIVLAGWLGIGLLRAEAVARSYFARAAGAGSRVVDVEVRTLAPAVPPFWAVNISGEVLEAGAAGPGYTSAMWLWVEPVTGWIMVFGKG